MLDRLAKLREMASNPALALELGRAAEYLVVSDLITQGIPAFLTDQGLAYDVVADLKGLHRVQVKAACFARNLNAQGRVPRIAYGWNVRRQGKLGRKRIGNDSCDIIALVALDINKIAYVPVSACSQSVALTYEAGPGRYGYTMAGLSSFEGAVNGEPRSLATNGRRAGIKRNGQLTLITAGLEL